MSQKEFQRVKVIENAAGGRLCGEASRLLQLSERQVQRLKRRYRPDSVGWVQHGNRGRSMPWAVSLPQKQLILSLARGKYQGFNDSHLTEKLRIEENLFVSRETVRRILRAAKLASPQKRRPRKYRSRRPPRPRFGMMVLTDASRHDWLEGRGPELTLMGFQDDATGQILAAHFQLEVENTLGSLRALRTMITSHGIPLSLYRDRHSIFQRNDSHWTRAEQLAGKQSPTQLGRALDPLGIEPIPAHSPQAKGRIERAWRTCQDRLVSELRLANTTTLQHANTVLASFCADYNQRFARPATDAACDFRSLPPRFDLARCLSLHYQRVVAADHTIALGAQSIALPPLPAPRGYAGETVELSHQLDGVLRVFRGDTLLTALPFTLQEHAERRPVQLTSAQKRKSTRPRIYNLSGRPALAAVT
ncbi:MAG: integrase catalytic region [Acidobacteriaceae bacterium]|nr:integrase catalytic region [Acidobacteriaceae bacterium]